MKYAFIPIDSNALREQVIALLRQNNLPTSDLDEHKQLFALLDDQQQLIGTGGLEFFGDVALLRSVSVRKNWQGKGLGKQINHELEKIVAQKGINAVYLLTTTAKLFFEKEGYKVIDRNDTPQSIKDSSEFTHVCPSTATVMKKQIANTESSVTPPQKLGVKKVLFVCVENSNRSQMSQAFAKIIGGDTVEAYSAGSKPSGVVNPKAIAAMKELGYDLSAHESKSLKEVEQYAPFDAVVTMGCGDACPWMPAKKFVDWEIPDPKNMEPQEFNKVRDLIAEKVKQLLTTL